MILYPFRDIAEYLDRTEHPAFCVIKGRCLHPQRQVFSPRQVYFAFANQETRRYFPHVVCGAHEPLVGMQDQICKQGPGLPVERDCTGIISFPYDIRSKDSGHLFCGPVPYNEVSRLIDGDSGIR